MVNLLLSAELVSAAGTISKHQEWEALVDHILDSSFELTLGNIIRRLEEKITLDQHSVETIHSAKQRRDFLAHRFFREHAEDFVTSSGRLRMLDAIEDHGTVIHEAMLVIDLAEAAVAKHLGDTPERREEFYRRYLEEVTRRK